MLLLQLSATSLAYLDINKVRLCFVVQKQFCFWQGVAGSGTADASVVDHFPWFL